MIQLSQLLTALLVCATTTIPKFDVVLSGTDIHTITLAMCQTSCCHLVNRCAQTFLLL